MGATNALLAYRLYAGRIPPLAMQLLAYMALVSKDDDARPWFGQGHEALALFAMGRPAPASDADLRAVRRAIAPLLSIGAIQADRRPAARRDGANTVRYRLHLVAEEPRSIDEPHVDNPVGTGQTSIERRTVSGPDVGRFVVERRTVCGRTQDGNRPTEEPRGTTRSEIEENHLDLEGESPPAPDAQRAHHDSTTTDDHDPQPPAPDPDLCGRCGVLLDPDRVCRNRRCADGSAVVVPLRRHRAA